MTRFLMMALDAAREHGLHRVMITCSDANFASARVIEKCGGVLHDKLPGPNEGRITRLHWIEL